MSKWRWLQIQILECLFRCGIKEDQLFMILTVLVGAVCGLSAVFFHLLIGWIRHLVLLDAVAEHWSYFWLVPVAGGLLAGFLLIYLPETRGSGIPQVKTAFFMQYGVIPLKVTVGKIFLGATCIGTGFSLGREGPTVQIAAGIASFFGRLFSLSRQKVRMLIPVGAAAGLAAAFNTPIAGVIFTLEEVVGDINARILGSTVIAAVTASVVEHSLLGGSPIFGVSNYHMRHPGELLLYVVLGVVAGGVSLAFIKGLLWLKSHFDSHSRLRVVNPAIGGLAAGLMALLAPQILGIGYPTVRSALQGKLVLATLTLLLLLKFLATVISYASGASGGIFAPALFIGAMLGGSLATLTEPFLPSLVPDPGAVALVGMGALFAGIIRAPMTSVLIIFEMTLDYQIILPLMISNLISYAISQRFAPVPLYDSLALQDGIHLPRHDQEHLLGQLLIEETMTRQVSTLNGDLTVSEALRMAGHTPLLGFPVVDRSGNYLGMISVRELKHQMASGGRDARLSQVIRPIGPHAHPDQSLEIALRKFGQYGVSRLAVLDRANPDQMLGIITVGDVMRAFGVVGNAETEA
ncbi:MAG: chloride channel protein [Acidobacteriota bacterium]